MRRRVSRLALLAVTALAVAALPGGVFAAVKKVPPANPAVHARTAPAKPAAKPANNKQQRATKAPLSMFAREAAMSPKQLITRWDVFVNAAAKRTNIPADWIRAVMMQESGGRTMLAENTPIVSSMGAMGLMQLMPQTWAEMQHIYKLGSDPYDPHDNIMAGAAYLKVLYWEYGYPGLFAAYNDGPGMIEAHRKLKEMLPVETGQYVLDIAAILRTGSRSGLRYEQLVVPMYAQPQNEDDDDAGTQAAAAPYYAEDNEDDYYHEMTPSH
jgi:soluble lytic murein transglycosylase-like protein